MGQNPQILGLQFHAFIPLSTLVIGLWWPKLAWEISGELGVEIAEGRIQEGVEDQCVWGGGDFIP